MKTIFVLFGSTGDLAKRKLFPALYNIYTEQGKEIDIIGVGRRDYDDKKFRDYIDEGLEDFVEKGSDFINFLDTVTYSKVQLDVPKDYKTLQTTIKNLDSQGNAQLIFYLSISPEYFGDFISNYKYIENKNARVVFEKPFGVDLASAKALNANIMKVFNEEQVYRIDHYLGKRAIQNILMFRFSNILFESIWNNTYIDNIQITAAESLGVEKRGGYYDTSGALRDMVQNHLFQALSLVTMSKPATLHADTIGQEKLKVFQNIHLGDTFENNIVFGQYDGYRDSTGVAEDSRTETFVAMKLEVQTPEFSGVPIYLRTGKLMNKKSTKIVVEFKNLSDTGVEKFKNTQKNRITFNIHSDEGIDIHFNIQANKDSSSLQKVHSTFLNQDNVKEAYQKLIEDMIEGDKTLFISWDVLKESWRIVEDLVNCKNNCPVVLSYKSGENGPKESYDLLERDGNNWYE